MTGVPHAAFMDGGGREDQLPGKSLKVVPFSRQWPTADPSPQIPAVLLGDGSHMTAKESILAPALAHALPSTE